MSIVQIEQLSSFLLLVVFLFGMTLGIVGGAVAGSRRGVLTYPAADGPVSAGARVIFGIYLRGYERDSRPDSGRPAACTYEKEGDR